MVTQIKVKHQHYLYAIGMQPKRSAVTVTTDSSWICPEECTVESMKRHGTFRRITGTKHFCTYMLVYDKTKPASDSRSSFPPLVPTYVSNSDLTVLSSPCIIRRSDLMQLDMACIEHMNMTDSLVNSTSDTAEIPAKRSKVLKDNCAIMKSTIENFRKFDLEEEETRK